MNDTENSRAVNCIGQASASESLTREGRSVPRFCTPLAVDLDPPITDKSLSELDICNLMKNPYLRHDLNFDDNLVVRPNGNRKGGTQRQLRSQRYWDVIEQGLDLYLGQRVPSKSRETCFTDLPCDVPLRMRRMFANIKSIMISLISESQRASVRARLDPELLLQQMEHGVLDVATLGEWLGQQLLASCSPERDRLILKMVSTMRLGAQKADSRLIVDGLKQLFLNLEIMKLVRHIECNCWEAQSSDKAPGSCQSSA